MRSYLVHECVDNIGLVVLEVDLINDRQILPERANLTFFQLMFFLLSDSKIDVAQVVPVTLFQKPADWSVLSTKPQLDPEVANWRLGLVGPGCSANYISIRQLRHSPSVFSAKDKTYIGVEEGKVLGQLRQKGRLLLIVGLDHKGRISGSRLVFL